MKVHVILGELYDRLARFDRWCTFLISRGRPHAAAWKTYAKTWRVRLSHQRTKQYVGISTEFPALADALEVAIDIAEWFEWGKEVPPLDTSPGERMKWMDHGRISQRPAIPPHSSRP